MTRKLCRTKRILAVQAAFVALLLVGCNGNAAAEPLSFRVHLDPALTDRPIEGRLYVFLTKQSRSEPRFGPNWFNPEPFFALDVKAFAPGTSRTVDDAAAGFPDRLSRLPPGEYQVQAVLDHSFSNPHQGSAPGNFHGDARRLSLDPDASAAVDLTLNRVVPPEPEIEEDGLEEVYLTSRLLSDFHGREVEEKALVILPLSYDSQARRRYPVIYIVPSFGGSHRAGHWPLLAGPREVDEGEVEFIRVQLSGQCMWGHHVHANSPTNGPRGDALVEELIPYIDEHFRTIPEATARFVTGHSSGGWSSLWLQVSYPETFGGVWSLAPDPVDFRDFQQIDLYADPPENMYRDAQDQRRPLARLGTKPVLWYDDFARMDDCLGRGGQLRSFEAVFSPLDSAGLPRRLWDRQTGQIDPQVARAWRAYDIRLLLRENWDRLGPKLSGKLHIVTGSLDTFYLEGAVELLAKTLDQLESDATVEIVPGGNHNSVASPERAKARLREMSEAFLKHHPFSPGM